MNFYKKARSVISLVCAALLILSALAVPTAAAETNSVTATSSAAVRQGDYAYCYVNIDSTEGLAALDVTVHYDPAKVKITDVYNSVSCTLYDSVTNTDNIQFSYIFDGQGTATKTRLFYFRYRVLDNAGTGDAFFDITVGEAYDSALNEMAVSGSRCNFTIAEKSTGKTCSVYSAGSVSTAVGQEFTLNYRLSTYQIASGTAVITYDSELFKVVKVTNGRFLDGKVTDVNADLTGEIYVSFVGTEYCTNTDFISVTFRTLKNTAETSKIAFKAKELLDKELNMYSCGGCTTSAKVIYDETYTGDSPSMRLNGTFSYDDAQITLTVSLEENSHLGAGDFVIGFDPALLSYNSCAKGFSPSFFNIDDKNVDSGKLKFHIISLSDIVTEETVLTAVFDVKRPYSFEKTDFTLGGTGLTDSMTEGILLNFVDTSVWPEYKVTFRNEDGTILQSDMYYYGDKINIPNDPERAAEGTHTYSFVGWDKEIPDLCTGNDVYTAVYSVNHTKTEVRGAVAATCCEEGYSGDIQCAECGTIIKSGVTVPASGNHKDADGKWESDAEHHWHTCYFGTKFDVETHTGGEWITDIPATPSTDGSRHIECVFCRKILKTEVIEKYFLYGDINSDGVVNPADAIAALRCDALLTNITEAQLVYSDVNGDGAVDIFDAILILQYDSHIIDKFPIEQ